MAGTDPNEGTGSRHDDIEAIIHAAGGELPLSLRGAHSAPSRSPRPAPPDTIFSGMLGYSSLTNDEQAFLSQVVAPVIMPGVEELNRRLGKPDGESVVRGIEVSRQSGLKILLDGARNLELVWTDPQEQARTADEPDARRIYLPRGYLTFLEGDHGAGIVLNWLRGTILHPHNTPRDPFFAPRTDCYGELLRPLQQDAIRSVNELQRNGEQGVLYIDHLVAARARVIRELVTDQVGQIREQLKDGPQRKLIVVLAHANSRSDELEADLGNLSASDREMFMIRRIKGKVTPAQLDQLGKEAENSDRPLVVVISAKGLTDRMIAAKAGHQEGYTRFARNLAGFYVDDVHAITGEHHLAQVEDLMAAARIPEAERGGSPISGSTREQPFLLLATNVPWHAKVPGRLLELVNKNTVAPYIDGGALSSTRSSDELVDSMIRQRQATIDRGEQLPVQACFFGFLDPTSKLIDAKIFKEVERENSQGKIRTRHLIDEECYDDLLIRLISPRIKRSEFTIISVSTKEEAEGLLRRYHELVENGSLPADKKLDALLSGRPRKNEDHPEWNRGTAAQVRRAIRAGDLDAAIVVGMGDKLHFPQASCWIDLNHKLSPQAMFRRLDALASPRPGSERALFISVGQHDPTSSVELLRAMNGALALAEPTTLPDEPSEDPETDILREEIRRVQALQALRAAIVTYPFFSKEGVGRSNFQIALAIDGFLSEHSYAIPDRDSLTSDEHRMAYDAIEWGLTWNKEIPAAYLTKLDARGVQAVIDHFRNNRWIRESVITEMEKILEAKRSGAGHERTLEQRTSGSPPQLSAHDRLVEEIEVWVDRNGRPFSKTDPAERALSTRLREAISEGTLQVNRFTPFTADLLGLRETDLISRLQRRLEDSGFKLTGSDGKILLPDGLASEVRETLVTGDARYQRAEPALMEALKGAFPIEHRRWVALLRASINENKDLAQPRALVRLVNRWAEDVESLVVQQKGDSEQPLAAIRQEWLGRLRGYLGVPHKMPARPTSYSPLEALSPAACAILTKEIIEPALAKGEIRPEMWKQVLQPLFDPEKRMRVRFDL